MLLLYLCWHLSRRNRCIRWGHWCIRWGWRKGICGLGRRRLWSFGCGGGCASPRPLAGWRDAWRASFGRRGGQDRGCRRQGWCFGWGGAWTRCPGGWDEGRRPGIGQFYLGCGGGGQHQSFRQRGRWERVEAAGWIDENNGKHQQYQDNSGKR